MSPTAKQTFKGDKWDTAKPTSVGRKLQILKNNLHSLGQKFSLFLLQRHKFNVETTMPQVKYKVHAWDSTEPVLMGFVCRLVKPVPVKLKT